MGDTHTQHKVLVVDDSAINIAYFKAILKKNTELLIYSAKSGKEALELLEKDNEVSLIFLDVQMPGMNGFDTLKAIRNIGAYEDVPVIFITAYHQSDLDVNLGYKLGASDYLLKPVEANIIRSKIDLFLKTHVDKKNLKEYADQILTQKEFISKIIQSIPSYLFLINEHNEIIFSNIDEDSFVKKYKGCSFDSFLNQIIKISSEYKIETEVKEISLNYMGNSYYFSVTFSNFVSEDTSNLKLTTIVDISKIRKIAIELSNQFQLMRTLLQAIPGPVFYKDANGYYLGCNEEFEKYIGLSKEDLIGKTVYQISPKEQADKYYQMDKDLLDNPGKQIYESKIKYADGEMKDVMFYKSTFKDSNHNVAGIIGVILDISERKRIEKELMSINKYEQTISKISSKFVSETDFDSSVNYSLQELGINSQAERSYIFLIDWDAKTMSNVFEWCAEGTSPEIENLQNLSLDSLPYWMDKLKKNETINISDIRKMPIEAKTEKEILEIQGIQSVLVLPIFIKEKLFGFVGFDNVSTKGLWSYLDINLLQSFTQVISGAYEQKITEEGLRDTNRSLNILSECNRALLEAQSEKELYFAFVEILTRIGAYPYVWCSKVIPDINNEEIEIKLVAESGTTEIINEKNFCISSLEDCCPIIRASNTLDYYIDNHLDCCHKCGIRNIDGIETAIFIPVESNTKHTSTINILSNKEKRFDKKEITLLLDLSKYLAYGLDSLLEKQQRENYEKQLSNEKEELSITLKNIADGVITIKINGVILFCNNTAENILKKSKEQLIGNSIYDIFHSYDNKFNKVMFNPVDMIQNLSEKENMDHKIEFTTDSGDRKILSLKVSAIHGTDQNISGIVIVFNDVSDKLIAEAQQQLSLKMESIGLLASGIAHEINTPLQFVGDNIYFLQEGFGTLLDYIKVIETDLSIINSSEATNIITKLNKIKEDIDFEFLEEEIPIAIDRSQNGIQRVSKIVKAMKSFAHPSGKVKTLSNINKSIEVTVEISKNEWKYVADIDMELDKDLPLVNCSIDEINQVILNLIINASHAIDARLGDGLSQKGKIFIRTGIDEGCAYFSVRDTGIGIEKDRIDRIFDPFYTTKEVGKGTGQGLAITHDIIVVKHNGKIFVESEPDVGTEFKIFLPLKDSKS